MNNWFKVILILCISGLTGLLIPNVKGQSGQPDQDGSFTFAFLTDIHLTDIRNSVPGFIQAIDSVNALHPDFVITGGDLIMDALAQRYSRADSLYQLYQKVIKNMKVPVYNTMGNHEIYGIYPKSGAVPGHPEYGEKMFEKRLGKSCYTFMHKGWKFFIINSVEDTKKGSYIGMIDSAQISWIRAELEHTGKLTPIVISAHIPFITATTQMYERNTKANDSGTVIVNAREVLALFKNHNLKLVLQGHQHALEDVYIGGIHFITGGAVSAAWWKGPYLGNEEGFVLVSVKKDHFDWRYVDYGWDANGSVK